MRLPWSASGSTRRISSQRVGRRGAGAGSTSADASSSQLRPKSRSTVTADDAEADGAVRVGAGVVRAEHPGIDARELPQGGRAPLGGPLPRDRRERELVEGRIDAEDPRGLGPFAALGRRLGRARGRMGRHRLRTVRRGPP